MDKFELENSIKEFIFCEVDKQLGNERKCKNKKYIDNKEYYKNLNKRVYSDEKRKEAIKKRSLDYYYKNRDAIREKTKERNRLNKLRYELAFQLAVESLIANSNEFPLGVTN